MFTPRDYVSMAQFLNSDIDLGNATGPELDALAVEAVANGWGFVGDDEGTVVGVTCERCGIACDHTSNATPGDLNSPMWCDACRAAHRAHAPVGDDGWCSECAAS